MNGDLNALKALQNVKEIDQSRLEDPLKLLYLRQGDLEQFEKYNRNISLPKPIGDYIAKHKLRLWRKEDLSNKTILILCDQGLGDVLFYSRYLSFFKQKCQKCYLLVRDDLKDYLSYILPKDELVSLTNAPPNIDFALSSKVLLTATGLSFKQLLMPLLDTSQVPAINLHDSSSEYKLKSWSLLVGFKNIFLGLFKVYSL